MHFIVSPWLGGLLPLVWNYWTPLMVPQSQKISEFSRKLGAGGGIGVFSSISKSFSSVCNSLVFWSTINWVAGFGHCRICAVISILYPHLGHTVDSCWPHWCIICPVVQNPVVNLVILHHCSIVIPLMTVCVVVQCSWFYMLVMRLMWQGEESMQGGHQMNYWWLGFCSKWPWGPLAVHLSLLAFWASAMQCALVALVMLQIGNVIWFSEWYLCERWHHCHWWWPWHGEELYTENSNSVIFWFLKESRLPLFTSTTLVSIRVCNYVSLTLTL